MDLKRLITHFTYRIEPKPEGGFIARASDPNLPPLEAPTRFELQQKIQANISDALASEFPSLKLPQNAQQLNVSFHIEHKPDGTFAIHSSDPNAPPLDATSAEEVERHFAEKMLNSFGGHFLNKLPPEVLLQLTSGDVKVFVTRNVGLNLKSDSQNSALSGTQTSNLPTQIATSTSSGAVSNSSFSINANDRSPITPARESSGTFFRFLAALLIVLAAMYFYFHFRH